jgi:NAD(P)-dependent dehydrogenase (short-subunit alcohol dehydrogenase family)
MPAMELQGKVAVVTGASSGIGEATARALAGAGMDVVAVARRAERLDALAASVDHVHAQPADVTSDDEVQTLAGAVASQFGACHLLVNNAGASLGGPFLGWDDVAEVRAALDVNFFGAIRCMAAFAPLLFASAPGRVVNVASVAGKIAAGYPGYSASKFALVGFTEGVGASWAARGVTVSQVNPGFVQTEGFPQNDLTASPLTRRLVATPELVAAAIVEVARSGVPERTVPRWYRPFVVARHVAAPVVRAATRRF